MSSGGGSGRARPGDAEERRQKRAEQLARTSDEEFRAEVQAHQTAKWGPTGLVEHYPLHGRDVASVLGRPISEDEYVALTKEIQLRPDRVFTGIDKRSLDINYVFIQTFKGQGVMIQVVTRAGLVRTMFPTDLQRWLRGHREMVEVTNRV